MQEKNIKIATMLGYIYYPFQNKTVDKPGWQLNKSKNKITNTYLCRTHKQLPFHRSWNSLMQVITFIEKIGYQVDFGSRLLPKGGIKDSWCTIRNDEHTVKITETNDEIKFKAVYKAVAEFAELYFEEKIKIKNE